MLSREFTRSRPANAKLLRKKGTLRPVSGCERRGDKQPPLPRSRVEKRTGRGGEGAGSGWRWCEKCRHGARGCPYYVTPHGHALYPSDEGGQICWDGGAAKEYGNGWWAVVLGGAVVT